MFTENAEVPFIYIKQIQRQWVWLPVCWLTLTALGPTPASQHCTETKMRSVVPGASVSAALGLGHCLAWPCLFG